MTPQVPWLVLALSLPWAAFAADGGSAVFVLDKATVQVKAEVLGYREAIQGQGFRFDEAAGTVLDPKTKKPLTVAKVNKLLSEIQIEEKRHSLETINRLLSGQDLSKPLSPELAGQLKEIAGDGRLAVPDSIRAAIAQAGAAPADGLKADAWKQYLASTRFFDGQQGLSGFEKAAIPVGKLHGWPSLERTPTYFDSTERQLGRALQADIVAHFSGYQETGPKLLDQFKDTSGQFKLPAVIVLKTQPEEGAHADPQSDSIVLNALQMTEQVVNEAPEKDRAALAKRLADPRELAKYLLANPQERRRFIADNDVPIYHELTHSTQFRRDRFAAEQIRGNTPDFDPLEYEQEAFMAENRFLNEKLKREPQEAIKSGYLAYYQQMLADYDGWRRAINQVYLSHPVYGSADLPTAEQLQEERARAAKELASSSLKERLIAGLKAVGFAHGDKQMRQALVVARSNVDDFGDSAEYRRMRVEGELNLAKAFEQADKIGSALSSVFGAQDADKTASDDLRAEFSAPIKQEADRLVDQAIAELKSGRGDVDERAVAASSLFAKGLLPEDMADIAEVVYLKHVLSLFAQGQSAAANSWLQATSEYAEGPEASAEAKRLYGECEEVAKIHFHGQSDR